MLVYVAVAALGYAYGVPWNIGLVIQPGQVLNEGALIPGLVAQGEAWRLISSVFLHSGVVHLGFNMLSLYFLGSFVEAAFGRGRFFALYLLSGISGGMAYLYFGAFGAPAVGASGAIFGILGALFVLERRGTIASGGQIAGLIVINLIITFALSSFISVGAHVGGLIGGVIVMFLMVRFRRSAALAIAAATVVTAAALLLSYWQARGYT